MSQAIKDRHIVLDLSCYNPSNKSEKIDYPKVKADGVEYVILKAININLNPDRRFEEHIAGCNAAGIKVLGTYHYTYANTEDYARTCARAWIKACGGRFKKFFLDYEDKEKLLKNAGAVKIIKAYEEEIVAAGHEFYIYTGLSWYQSYFKPYLNQLPYKFWIARYYAGYNKFKVSDEINSKYTPQIQSELVGWQYTSSGNVKGINGVVDMSIWYENLYKPTAEETAAAISPTFNPYTEPTANVKLGTTGNDANWVLWYLWRFGLLLDESGNPDSTRIDGMIEKDDLDAIRLAQKILGTNPDAIVGKITRRLFTAVC